MNDHLLADHIAVVTGAGRGIGRSHARRLAAYGARVVVNDIGVAIDGSPTDETPADEVVAEIIAAGGEAIVDHHDISTFDGGAGAVQTAIDTWGRVDIVVNNAGIGRPRMIFNLEESDWDDVIRVHLKGTFAVTREACRWWRSEGKAGKPVHGRIVNTATGLLPMGGAGQSNYVAAKAGIAAFTAAVAQEMEEYDVTANAIMPGARTRMADVGWRTVSNAGKVENQG
jgi:NAD(P)-dependent dehydrogenase (short-subunit alcohol dehydrogenase family)